MGFSLGSSGSFDRTESFLKKSSKLNIDYILEQAGRDGVAALSSSTPRDTGLAASSWGYVISKTHTGVSVTWTNSDVENGFPVVIALQYGYATGAGGYVTGRDFIAPALQPIFDRIADQIWREVTSA